MHHGYNIILTILIVFHTQALLRADDVNSDNRIDSLDIGVILSQWNTASTQTDFNSDGTVNNDDLRLVLHEINNTPCGAINFIENSAGNYDHLKQVVIPAGFGEAEFTLEIWVRPDINFPVGSTQFQKLVNWSSDDIERYSIGSWWFLGNFLLDGHNNNSVDLGTFSLQFYAGGRVRWLFGDASPGLPVGGLWGIQPQPTSTSFSLLDGNWHIITLVRRWSGETSADLEMWIDGEHVNTQTSLARTNMRQFWNTWPGYPSNEDGWFWGAEKQAATRPDFPYEDYKGLIDELRFWNRAKTTKEITTSHLTKLSGNENGLIGLYRFSENTGNSYCNALNANDCISFGLNGTQSATSKTAQSWSCANAPMIDP